MASRRFRQRVNLLAACCAALVLFLFFRGSFTPQPSYPVVEVKKETAPLPDLDARPQIKKENEPPEELKIAQQGKPKAWSKIGGDEVELVVASMRKENVTWLHEYLPDWKKSIYVVDDPTAEFTVPLNKGREAMVFLTYIIDRYDSLPENVIFHHAERFQWHNDNLDYDALPLLQKFKIERLKNQGYVNLRCAWVLGCPVEIRPKVDATPGKEGEPVHAKHVYKAAFEELFPGVEVPDAIGVNCCSQFGVRRETIKQRPKSEYIRYREWLKKSPLGDALSGRVLEYSWHLIFGKKAIYCPNAGECYCQTYGICDKKCDERSCDNQYILPPYATLPKGWPHLGWKGEDREWSGQP